VYIINDTRDEAINEYKKIILKNESEDEIFHKKI